MTKETKAITSTMFQPKPNKRLAWLSFSLHSNFKTFQVQRHRTPDILEDFKPTLVKLGGQLLRVLDRVAISIFDRVDHTRDTPKLQVITA
jgi:hypothetical protein